MLHPVSPTPTAAIRTGMDRRLPPGRMAYLRRWRWPALALLVAAAACALMYLVPASGTLAVSGTTLTLATASEAPFQDYLPVRATIAPLRTVFVGAVEGGTVSSVPVLDGATVQAGETLATLVNPQLQLDVTSREAAIASQLGGISAQRLALQQSQVEAQNNIADAGYNLLKAERDLSIRSSLLHEGFESPAGLKTFQDAAQYYATRLRLLRRAQTQNATIAARQEAEIDDTSRNLQRNLQVVQASLQSLVLRAPVAGRLTNFALQPGQNLKQGEQIGQIDSTDAYRLDADIDEFYLARVQPGETASADIGGVVAQLHVSRVKPQISNGQFRAELVFDGAPPAGLRRGESVDTKITLGNTENLLLLPNGAWLEGSGGSFVYVLDKDGHYAERRNIVSGRRTPEQVEISAGLQPGERVIVSSYGALARFPKLLIQ
jgi:HlyD family secretion protein